MCPEPDPVVSQCPKCGVEFECAAAAGLDGCWCAALPHVMPCCGGSDAACFCKSCLEDAMKGALSVLPAKETG